MCRKRADSDEISESLRGRKRSDLAAIPCPAARYVSDDFSRRMRETRIDDDRQRADAFRTVRSQGFGVSSPAPSGLRRRTKEVWYSAQVLASLALPQTLSDEIRTKQNDENSVRRAGGVSTTTSLPAEARSALAKGWIG
jgi:hypothetical protein